MSVILDDFRGVFYSDELSTAYTFVTRADTLVATHSRHGDIELSPTKEDTFAGNAWFFSQIEFIRDGSNKING